MEKFQLDDPLEKYAPGFQHKGVPGSDWKKEYDFSWWQDDPISIRTSTRPYRKFSKSNDYPRTEWVDGWKDLEAMKHLNSNGRKR